MKTINFVLLFLLVLTLPSMAQLRENAFKINERLGRGINMGNCFEAPTETEWGNPWKSEYFRLMAEQGIKHVRIPIRWEPAARSSALAPYTINQTFLNRIKQVVDTALKYKLHAIINMHHHDALIADPDGQKARFISQWQQIAGFFKNYPDSLLFEVMNEPNGALTAVKWNTFFADALTEIRKTNPNRCVLMGLAEWGGLSGLNALQLPADENIILTIHYYNPFQFTHQGAEWSGAEAQNWLGTKWNDTETERKIVADEFKAAKLFSASNHIPVHIGEFGAYNKADLNSRVRWTTFLSRWFEEQGFSWAYWEFSAGFGIYNPATKQWLTPLVNALMTNPMPQPTPIIVSPVYSSNFISGTDGWNVYRQSTAVASMAVSGGKLNITIANGGTEGWHVQLVRNNVALQKGVVYRVTFAATATQNCTVTGYTRKNAEPWIAYSNYDSFQLNQVNGTFSYMFTASATDAAARMVFDLGKFVTGITITDIKIETVSILSSISEISPEKTVLFPNPVSDVLYVTNNSDYNKVEIFNQQGSKLIEKPLTNRVNPITISNLPSGIYIVRLSGKQLVTTSKIVKK